MKTERGIQRRIAELKPDRDFWENKYKASGNLPAEQRNECEFRFKVLCARIAELEWVLDVEWKMKRGK